MGNGLPWREPHVHPATGTRGTAGQLPLTSYFRRRTPSDGHVVLCVRRLYHSIGGEPGVFISKRSILTLCIIVLLVRVILRVPLKFFMYFSGSACGCIFQRKSVPSPPNTFPKTSRCTQWLQERTSLRGRSMIDDR